MPSFWQPRWRPWPRLPSPRQPLPSPPPPAAAPAKAAPAAALVGNKESKTFHKADCKTAAKMKEANKTTFATAAEATKAGYKACKVCKP